MLAISELQIFEEGNCADDAESPASFYQVKLQISEICSLLDVDGIRGDIVTNRAARALVALEGRDVVSMADVKRIIGVCVNHRLESIHQSVNTITLTLTALPSMQICDQQSGCCHRVGIEACLCH